MEAPRRRPRPTTWALVAAAIIAFTTSVPASGAGTGSLRASDLETSLSVAVDRYDELDRRVRDLADAGARTERKVRRLAREMLALEKEARRAAIELYKSGTTPAVEGLMEMDLANLEETLSYLESSARFRVSVFQTLAARRGRLDVVLDRLAVAQEAAEEARAEMALVQADIRERLRDARAEPAVVEKATEIATAEPPAAPTVPGPPYNADWDAIAMCESGGNWHLDSTYDGGLQFHPMTWLGHGGSQYARYAWQATREEQIAIAEKVLASQGPGAWGSCYTE